MGRSERQEALVETHRAIRAADLPHVFVGGWAVSAFQTRFTTDIDVVLPRECLQEYHALLADLGYSKSFDTDVSNVYEGRMVGYERDVGGNSVQIEALVDALRCRQTDAEWSYRYLESHSVVRSVDVAPELEARIPEPALLFAVKLHSGRTTDARDLVVIATEAELDRVDRHLYRGDADELTCQIEAVLDRITADGFDDAFKGVFRQETLPEIELEAVAGYLRRTLEEH